MYATHVFLDVTSDNHAWAIGRYAAIIRFLSEEELHERAAWRKVQKTGKPVLLDDKLLMPSGMSA
jgi:hypothetical protein